MKRISSWLLSLSGWTLVNKEFPPVNKAILIFAPHTSNWDFLIMMLAKFALGFQVRYLGKHSLFYWPYGWFFKALGGMPVVRNQHDNVVSQVVEIIAQNENILLALSPEGTRSFTPFWKSGFYHIAEKAKLPLILFYLDCKTRSIGFGEVFEVTGNIDEDMLKIRDFYADKEGYFPKQASIVQTKKQYQLSRSHNETK